MVASGAALCYYVTVKYEIYSCVMCGDRFAQSCLNNGKDIPCCKTCESNFKRYVLKMLNGNKCSICGYSDHDGALVFHHKDRSTKSFSLGKEIKRELNELIEESEKCILVCSNCHKKIHHTKEWREKYVTGRAPNNRKRSSSDSGGTPPICDEVGVAKEEVVPKGNTFWRRKAIKEEMEQIRNRYTLLVKALYTRD